MGKLYISYIPKVKGDGLEFKIVTVLKKCMRFYSENNNIISSPGYLSHAGSVADFADQFKDIVPTKDAVYISYFTGIGNGMTPLGTTLIELHYDALESTGKFKRLNVCDANKTDHRKMMFFYGIDNYEKFNRLFENAGMLNSKVMEAFLDSITVNAVLIGSSNQSFTTYYGRGRRPADKGEADVLMFVGKNSSPIEEMYVDGTVIFEEICGVDDPHDYLKSILADFLKSALA